MSTIPFSEMESTPDYISEKGIVLKCNRLHVLKESEVGLLNYFVATLSQVCRHFCHQSGEKWQHSGDKRGEK